MTTTVPDVVADGHGEPGAARAATAVVDLGAGRGPDWLDAALAEELAGLVALRRQVHARPEPSWAEHATTAAIQAALAGAGIKSSPLPGGTGLVADIGSGRRAIGLRADIDALPLPEITGLPFASTVPDMAHACGHDVHLTVLVGAALALARAPQLPGRVRLLFQPAEEVMPGGGHRLAESGALDGLELAYALHCDPRLPVGQVGLRTGAITSTCDVIELTVRGPGGHTSRPYLTADLVNALGLVAIELPALLARRLDPRAGATLTWGAIHAGEAANAIPEHGLLRGTLRIMERSAWDGAQALVTELIEAILAPTRASFELDYRRGVPPVVNDGRAVAVLQRAVTTAIGPAAVAAVEQSTGAEDFSVVLEHAPGALARLGVWDGVGPQADLHSPGFRADERAIAVGVRTLVHTALTALTAPGAVGN